VLKNENVLAFQEIAPVIINSFSGGAIFTVTDKNKIIWKLTSNVFDAADQKNEFDVPQIKVGLEIRSDSGPYLAMQEKRIVEEKVPRAVYGMRLITKNIPIFDDNGDAVGCLSFLFPRLHPVGAAFPRFAPLIADMFPEGAFIFMTDLDAFRVRQPSHKFNIPDIQWGVKLPTDGVARRAITTRMLAVEELDASIYGAPVLMMSYPIFDEDDPIQVVGTFCIAQPRQTVLDLRIMSTNLSKSLEEISAVIQELAASASDISSNEYHLNQNIKEVSDLSFKINDVLIFIKQIADETKMLGLNASIEAARAGEVGRGFGVVAEEIRKLSDESKNTVAQIRGLTESIDTKVEETIRNSQITLNSGQEQAAAIQEITASIEEINIMAERLEKIALGM
jgi:hypothetical protein